MRAEDDTERADHQEKAPGERGWYALPVDQASDASTRLDAGMAFELLHQSSMRTDRKLRDPVHQVVDQHATSRISFDADQGTEMVALRRDCPMCVGRDR